jgi:hypothetical protein
MAKKTKERNWNYIDLGTQELKDLRATEIMEMLRQRVALGFGVTVIGPYMTLRFNGGDKNRLIQVSFQVTGITDSNVIEYEETPQ